MLARPHHAKRLQMSCSGLTRWGRTTGWPVAYVCVCACMAGAWMWVGVRALRSSQGLLGMMDALIRTYYPRRIVIIFTSRLSFLTLTLSVVCASHVSIMLRSRARQKWNCGCADMPRRSSLTESLCVYGGD